MPRIPRISFGILFLVALLVAIATAPTLPFLALGFFPLYARIPRQAILEHGAREAVYERIRVDPGVSTHELCAAVQIGWSTLSYHLRMLERSEMVVSVRDGRYRRFFDREGGAHANGRKAVVAAVRNPGTRTVAQAIRLRPGLSQRDLSLQLGLAPSSIHWHIRRLERTALVVARRAGHHVRYDLGPAWHEIPSSLLDPEPPSPAPPPVAALAAPQGA